MYHWNGMGGYWWSWLGWFVVLIIVVFIVYILVKTLNSGSDFPAKKEDSTAEALKLLNERYARGDISEEEYLHRKKILTEDHY
jgi:putative membrane protein